MNVQEAYNIWSEQYDTNENKTRDLEAISLRQTLAVFHFKHCLEIGCGTGKNTEWLKDIADNVLAIDFSEEMLSKAVNKITAANVRFQQADINKDWDFALDLKFDLVTFSLVLEHIENLDTIFKKLDQVLSSNGIIYIGELHPFKQYSGSKARFETNNGIQEVTCFTHHISDFINTAKKYNFKPIDINEYFDDDNRTLIPRILTLTLNRQ